MKRRADTRAETVLGYAVVRSNRKSVGLTVSREGVVTVRAPRHVPLSELERVVNKHRAWLENAVQKALSAPPLPSAEEQAALRERAQRELPALVELWAERIGVQPTSVRVTAARGRFGSCSGRNRLCFSLFLFCYPPEAVEYVVVHELCHIRYHDHSKQFWALVESFLPDFAARKKLLFQEKPK